MKHVQSCDAHPRYRNGCEPCLRRKHAYNKRYDLLALQGRRLSVAPDLTQQRLQELRALGYSISQLAEATGLAPATVWRLSSETHTRWLQLGTFHAVEKVWRGLREYPAVGGGHVRRSVRVAAEHGWTGPEHLPTPPPVAEDDIDEEVVRRAVNGQRVTMTRAETGEAWRQLEARNDLTLRQIAERLHTSEKTIGRWRNGEHQPSSSRARKRSA